MEVVAAASSVAGIASLVAQSLAGLGKLYNLFEDCRNASKTAERFLKEVIKLKETIEEVEKLVVRIDNLSGKPAGSTLATLSIHLEDCAKGISEWLVAAQNHPSPADSKAKKRFKNFILGMKVQTVKDLFQEMSRHRHGLSLSLSATGRALEIDTLQQSASLLTKVDEVASYSKVTVEALTRLESRFNNTPVSNCGSNDPSQSLSDIASQLSRIESMMSSGYSPGSHYESDHSSYTSQNMLPPNRLPLPPKNTYPNRAFDILTGRSNPRIQILAGFAGYGSNSSIRKHVCLCCELESRFDSMADLKEHESERPFGCLYCPWRFRSRGQIEQHLQEKHYGLASWSCANLIDWQTAYCQPRRDSCDQGHCGYCGREFPRRGPGVQTEEDCVSRLRHLQQSHLYNECDMSKNFFQPEQFREHLKQSHGAKMDESMDFLVEACMIDESIRTGKAQTSEARAPDFPILDDYSYQSSREAARIASGEMTHELIIKYGAFSVGVDSEDCPDKLGEYLRLTRRAETLKSDARLILALLRRVDRSIYPFAYMELLLASKRIESHLTLIDKSLEESQVSCWKQGFDLTSFEKGLDASKYSEMIFTTSEMDRDEKTKCEDLINTWQGALQEQSVGTWSTTNDRINLWMLRNLAACPEARKIHKSYLDNGEDLDEIEWARLVLKHWLIDEAAVGIEGGACSTNGAVDSSGMCHSTRIRLETLPTRKRKGFDDSQIPAQSPSKRAKIFADE